MSHFAVSLRLVVTECEDSVVSVPSLNCPLFRRNCSARCREVPLMPISITRPNWLRAIELQLRRGCKLPARENPSSTFFLWARLTRPFLHCRAGSEISTRVITQHADAGRLSAPLSFPTGQAET